MLSINKGLGGNDRPGFETLIAIFEINSDVFTMGRAGQFSLIPSFSTAIKTRGYRHIKNLLEGKIQYHFHRVKHFIMVMIITFYGI